MSRIKRADKGKRKPHDEYAVHTGQEADALMRAASDGKHGEHWHEVEQMAACVFEVPGLSHSVRLQLTSDEQRAGLTLDALKELRQMQDSDSAFALLYISRQMAESQPTPDNPTTNIEITLDDIIAAIGLDPRTTTQRAELRQRIWAFIKFGERAEIVGQRTGIYQDKMTGKQIETRIESAPWRIMEKEMAAQGSLFPDGDIPLRVELAPSKEWMKLLLNPSTAQFLPLGEVLGAIPPAKPSGAWARVVGLALANLWRRKPREALSGELKPIRRELLTHYAPRTGSVEDVVNSNDPRRAVQYWASALEILAEVEFIEKSGEVTLGYDKMRAGLGRQDWANDWLNGVTDIRPGPAMIATLEQISCALPTLKPRDLKRPRYKRKSPS